MNHTAEPTTQTEKILAHLERFGSITALDALNLYGCFRLAARIRDLKDEGHSIRSTPWKTPGGATIARYSLVRVQQQATLNL